MNLLHIRSRKACDLIMRKGTPWKGKMMMVRWLPGPPKKAGLIPVKGLYFGTYASTKLHKSAVKRNRMRRRVREAFRLHLKKNQDIPALQLLVTPRIASLDAPFEEIQRDLEQFLLTLPKNLPWPTPKNPAPADSSISA